MNDDFEIDQKDDNDGFLPDRARTDLSINQQGAFAQGGGTVPENYANNSSEQNSIGVSTGWGLGLNNNSALENISQFITNSDPENTVADE